MRPSFSPDGNRIAFMSQRDGGNAEVYVMNADGTGQTRLTKTHAWDTYPAFSPDGNQIAFQSDRDGNHEIYVMNLRGQGVTRITNHAAVDSAPDWQPARGCTGLCITP
jgi:TolB protein